MLHRRTTSFDALRRRSPSPNSPPCNAASRRPRTCFNVRGIAPQCRRETSIHCFKLDARCILSAWYHSRHCFEQNCLCASRWRIDRKDLCKPRSVLCSVWPHPKSSCAQAVSPMARECRKTIRLMWPPVRQARLPLSCCLRQLLFGWRHRHRSAH